MDIDTLIEGVAIGAVVVFCTVIMPSGLTGQRCVTVAVGKVSLLGIELHAFKISR